MRFRISSSRKTQIMDITGEIESRVENDGVCTVFVPHTTAGLTLNESEDRLLEDMEEFMEEIAPEKDHRHDRIDDNASSHLRNLVLDSSVSVPVENGDLQLGEWQSVLFVELDGPRTRTVNVKVTD